ADGPDAHNTIGVAREEDRAIGRPGERHAVWELSVLALWLLELWLEVVHDDLGLEVPDLDARGGGSAQPVAVWREHQGVDDVAGDEGVETLAFVEVPEHGSAVLAARSADRAIWRHGDRVEVTLVAEQVGAELTVGQVPDLDDLVPTSRHNQWVGGRWREAHARDPLGVAFLRDRVLALAEGVPELDGLVTRARHDLTVVGAEGDRQHILGVSDEAAGGDAGVQVPETESAIPRARERELAIRRDDDVLHEVRVALETTTGEAVRLTVVGELPHEQRLVARGRQEKVWVLAGRGNGRHGLAVVAIELTAWVDVGVSHGVLERGLGCSLQTELLARPARQRGPHAATSQQSSHGIGQNSNLVIIIIIGQKYLTI
ncbi:TPA: hypothetical protein N0F65_009300, partial [Lagenidium giganteum]